MNAHPPREPLILWLTVAFALGVLVMDIARDYRDAPEAVEQIERAEVRT